MIRGQGGKELGVDNRLLNHRTRKKYHDKKREMKRRDIKIRAG